jgi:hypothetical protein
MSQQTSSPTDLVFVVTGGQRFGEQIAVKTEKCFLDHRCRSPQDNQPKIAIYRGPAGATLQAYGDEVLVNGKSISSHWLTVGDQIQFPNQTILEVSQLGQFSGEAAIPAEHEESERVDMTHPKHFNAEPLEAQQKLSHLESKICEIQVHHEFFQGRFNELDQRLSLLTDQLENLVVLAGSGPMFQLAAENPTIDESQTAMEQWVDSMSLEPAGKKSLEPDETVLGAHEESFEAIMEKLNAGESIAPEQTGSAAQPKNESVADLLARMKSEGQLDQVEFEDESLDETPLAAESNPFSQATPEPTTVQLPPNGQESDVDDYMSQLLSRIRGGNKSVLVPDCETVNQEVSVDGDCQPVPGPAATMMAEEFVPSQKPKKIESLSAMRELANSTARTAVADSEEDRRKALAYVQFAIAVAALVMSVFYFAVNCRVIGDTSFLVGILCVGLAGFLGFRAYTTINSKPEEQDSK